MHEDQIDYQQLLQQSLRDVVRRALEIAATQGLPGQHHYYISFRTRDPRVGISSDLRRQYPEEMTIVLQHQYRDLEVEAESFSVRLSFGGALQTISVPFEAITSFFDPSVEFGLRFDSPADEEADEEAMASEEVEPVNSPSKDSPAPGKVVSLKDFRKK